MKYFNHYQPIYNSNQDASGVYCLMFGDFEAMYIGSSKSLKARFQSHRFFLRIEKHHNMFVQAFYNKWGLEKTTFLILELCDTDNLKKCEQKWIDKIKKSQKTRLLNIANAI